MRGLKLFHKSNKRKGAFPVPFPYLIFFSYYFYRFTHISFGEPPYFWQKNPRTEIHPLPNVKIPLNTQKNNFQIYVVPRMPFMGFVGFPQSYPLETKTPDKDRDISQLVDKQANL